MLSTSAPLLLVMDADLQHDESIIPKMLDTMEDPDVDIVVGSRLVCGGASDGLTTRRRWASRISSDMARRALNVETRDLMSGFFMVRRGVVDASARQLSGLGFKILVDVIASAPRPLRIVEIPFVFRARTVGESKLDANAIINFVLLLIDKLVGHWVPARFVAFAAVGLTGIFVHIAVLWLGYIVAGASFTTGQTIAVVCAITTNYALNNEFTYRDFRLRGWQWFKGWISFSLVSAVGAVGNVGIASALFSSNVRWEVAALAGIVIGTVWNFGMTRAYTWGLR